MHREIDRDRGYYKKDKKLGKRQGHRKYNKTRIEEITAHVQVKKEESGVETARTEVKDNVEEIRTRRHQMKISSQIQVKKDESSVKRLQELK